MCCIYACCWGDIRAIYTTHEFIINLKDLPLLPPLSILLTTICTPYIYAHNNDNIQRGGKIKASEGNIEKLHSWKARTPLEKFIQSSVVCIQQNQHLMQSWDIIKLSCILYTHAFTPSRVRVVIAIFFKWIKEVANTHTFAIFHTIFFKSLYKAV